MLLMEMVRKGEALTLVQGLLENPNFALPYEQNEIMKPEQGDLHINSYVNKYKP